MTMEYLVHLNDDDEVISVYKAERVVIEGKLGLEVHKDAIKVPLQDFLTTHPEYAR
jgi:hypothetical protein